MLCSLKNVSRYTWQTCVLMLVFVKCVCVETLKRTWTNVVDLDCGASKRQQQRLNNEILHLTHNQQLLPLLLPEMLESSNLITFNGLANSSSYDAFLLDEERGRLLVGAEDHIFSFDLVNLNRDQKQVTFRRAGLNSGCSYILFSKFVWEVHAVLLELLASLFFDSVHYNIYFFLPFALPTVCLGPDRADHNIITPPGLG